MVMSDAMMAMMADWGFRTQGGLKGPGYRVAGSRFSGVRDWAETRLGGR